MRIRRLLLLVLLLSSAAFAQVVEQWVENTYYPATVLLYSQNEEGNMTFHCTATLFEREGGTFRQTYRAVTASHCVSSQPDESLLPPKADRTWFYVTTDEDDKKFYRVKVLGVGDQSAGDDFAVLEFKTGDELPVVPLGLDSTSTAGESVVMSTAPQGLGKQVFTGRITSPKLKRPVEVKSISWTNAVMLQVPGLAPGSSGSSVVCENQRAICAIFVGTYGGEQVAIPVSRFKKFYSAVRTKSYRPTVDMDSK